jgi:hypothetical protein
MASANAAGSDLPDLETLTMRRVGQIHREPVAPAVHHRW